MAEGLGNYVPSTTGQGQGKAQVLQGGYQSVKSPLGDTLSGIAERTRKQAEEARERREKELEEARKVSEITQNITASPLINDLTTSAFNEIKEKAKNAGSVEEQIALINQLKNINARTKELGELVKDRTSKLQGANIVGFNEETGKYEQITIPKNLKDFTQRPSEEQLKEFIEDPTNYFAKLNEALYAGLAENEFTPPPRINEQASELLDPKFMSEDFEGVEERDGKLVTTKKRFYPESYLSAKFDEVIQNTTDENLVKEFALDNNLPIAEAAGIFNEKGEIYNQYIKDKRQEFLDAYGLSANVISATNAPKDGDDEDGVTEMQVQEVVDEDAEFAKRQMKGLRLNRKVNARVGDKIYNSDILGVMDVDGVPTLRVSYKRGDNITESAIPLESIKGQLNDTEYNSIMDSYNSIKGDRSLDVDEFVSNVSSGNWNKTEAAQKLSEFFPELSDIEDPSWDADDLSFTYNGEKKSFNLDVKSDVKKFKDFINSISEKGWSAEDPL